MAHTEYPLINIVDRLIQILSIYQPISSDQNKSLTLQPPLSITAFHCFAIHKSMNIAFSYKLMSLAVLGSNNIQNLSAEQCTNSIIGFSSSRTNAHETTYNRLPALCQDTRLQPFRLHQHCFRTPRIPHIWLKWVIDSVCFHVYIFKEFTRRYMINCVSFCSVRNCISDLIVNLWKSSDIYIWK